jgi:olefin beta-lactone synthetase
VNIAQLLKDQVASRGQADALIDNSRGTTRTWSFAEVDDAAARIAAQMHGAGLRAGDGVLLLQPLSAELYVLFVALLRSGLVAVFVDPSAGLGYVERCCGIYPPKAMIGSAKAHLLRLVSPALRRIPIKLCTNARIPATSRLDFDSRIAPRDLIEDLPPDFPAIVRFTSGSTGEPKAGVRTHGFLMEQQRVLQRSISLRPGDVDLVTMPMFVLSNLAAGVTSVLPRVNLRAPGRIPPDALLAEIRRFRPSRTIVAPALLERLADHCAANAVKLDSFRMILTGGGPVFPRLLRKVRAVAPSAETVAVYGSTEAEPIALLQASDISPEDFAAMASGRGLLTGTPDAAIAIGILPPDLEGGTYSPEEFARLRRGVGESGQIVVSGPHVQARYLSEEANRANKIHVGETVWHQTGDAGFLDDQGRLWLLGRVAAGLSGGQEGLYPFAVEAAAMEQPEVQRAALLVEGERRVLVLQASETTDLAEVRRKLEWAQLTEIHRVAQIPLDQRHNSKVDYPALRRLVGKFSR